MYKTIILVYNRHIIMKEEKIMFYFLANPIISYNLFLIAAAVIPAVILMVKVYKSDRLEKESPALMRKLVVAGVLSALLALVEEWIGEAVLNAFLEPSSTAYNVILYFIIVAFSEESSKYLLLKKRTWKNPEFNCSFDGVVYAVFVSLGFALWENISYVMSYGFSTAIVRAVTAIPGHACFGVFMGVFYGMAKRAELHRKNGKASVLRKLSVIFPVILHGAYDYIASNESDEANFIFLIFIAVMFIGSYILVGKQAKKDTYLTR